MGVRTGDQGECWVNGSVEADSQTGSQGEGRRKFVSCLMGGARMLLSVTLGFCLCEVPRVGGKGFGLMSKLLGSWALRKTIYFLRGRVLILLQIFCFS